MRVFRVSQEDAEELAQDVFVRFYKALDEYRGEAEWAYLESIALNVARNRIRAQNTAMRNGVIVNIDDPAHVDRLAAPEREDYAEAKERERQQRLLYEAVADLPRGQRQCMLLWLGGEKYKSIAKALRIGVDAVKSRIRDAKRALHARLGDAGTAGLPEAEDEE